MGGFPSANAFWHTLSSESASSDNVCDYFFYLIVLLLLTAQICVRSCTNSLRRTAHFAQNCTHKALPCTPWVAYELYAFFKPKNTKIALGAEVKVTRYQTLMTSVVHRNIFAVT